MVRTTGYPKTMMMIGTISMTIKEADEAAWNKMAQKVNAMEKTSI